MTNRARIWKLDSCTVKAETLVNENGQLTGVIIIEKNDKPRLRIEFRVVASPPYGDIGLEARVKEYKENKIVEEIF